MRRVFQTCAVMSLLLTNSLYSHADTIDRDWEKQVTEKLADEIENAEVLWLDANGDSFLGLYTDQTNETAHGAVIVLHSMGGHADWPQTISPVRTALPEHGWTTLSIQLPIVSAENPLENYGQTLPMTAERIKAAVKLLRDRKFLNIVVIAHSFGAASTLAYLEKEKGQKVVALVAIGLHEYPFVKPAIDVLELIEKSKIPVLDIYGARDFKKVVSQAPDRRLAAKKGDNQQYEQLEIEGADHYFNNMEDVLIKRIRGWLNRAAPGVSIFVDENFDGNLEQEEETTTPAE